MEERELINLMDSVESFRLEYAARLRPEHQSALERAEIVIREIITEDEELRQQLAELRTCATCGGRIEHGKCVCWAMFADALQQFMAADYDWAAQESATLWDSLNEDDKERVWAGTWLAERALCPYCADWQQAERTNVHHPECETRTQRVMRDRSDDPDYSERESDES